MNFLPQHHFILDPFAFFGLIIFICHIIGELAYKTKILPRISGYILLGIILGPNVLNWVDKVTLSEMKILTDISLGLILFIIGRHLDFKWLLNDKGLSLTCLSEFGLTVLLTFLLMYFLGIGKIEGFLAALIAATTSPSIVLLVAQGLNSSGPVTRRTLIITSVNNLLAIAIFTLLLPFIDQSRDTLGMSFLYAGYRFLGSIFLALILFKVFEYLAFFFFEKKKQRQFILLISFLILSTSIAEYLNLSNLLVLISFGIATRNFDKRHALLEFNLDFFTHIFFIPLFFITGCYLDFKGFILAPVVVTAYIFIRIIAKSSGVLLFRKISDLTNKQAVAVAGALMPMSGIAIGIASKINDFNPDLGAQLLWVVSAAVALWGIVGPIIVQSALLTTGEAFDYSKRI